jgi:hypothetical protein
MQFKFPRAGGILFFFMLSVTASQYANAQVSGGTIRGSVTDPSGAVIPNAHVLIENDATHVKQTMITNGAGIYIAPDLNPGTYSITASAKGFATFERTGADLTVGAVLVVNMILSVGAQTEKVVVSDVTSNVELGTSELSGVVGQEQVTQLPLNGRDWSQLATLEPGVSAIRGEQATDNRVQQGSGQQMSISGGRPWQNNYLLDGISINDYANGAPGSALGSNLGVDAIKEFSVVSSNYPAQYGRTSGGIVNAVTNTGTSAIHGSVYEFLRNSALDGSNYFDTTKPEFRRNQFGGSVGGPIKKDRAFYFGDYEGVRQNLGVTQITLVPSAATRQGNLSSGTVTVDPTVSNFIKAFYPLPNGPLTSSGDTGKFSFAGADISSEDFATTKETVQFSHKDSMNAMYLYDKSNASEPDEFNNKLFRFGVNRHIGSVDEDHVFSNSFINTARVGVNRVEAREGDTSQINPATADASYGAEPGSFAPSVAVPGLAAFSGGLNGFSIHRYWYTSYQASDNAYLTKGIQSMQFGFSVERIDSNEFAEAGPTGAFKFGSLSAFLTNQPKSFQGVLPGHLSVRGIRETILGGYFQDDIKVSSRFTANVGLRYEISTVPTEAHNHLAHLANLTDSTLKLGAPFFSNPTLKNFEPRFGFSWDPKGNGKTAIRGGAGIFDVLPLPYQFELETEFTYPFFAQGTINTLPPGTFETGAYNLIAGNSNTLRGGYVQQHPPRNYVMNWNLNIQRELASGLTGLVAYVGSHGIHNASPSDDMDSTAPTLTNGQLFFPVNGDRINPNFGRISGVIWTGSSEFNALELKVSQNMRKGVTAQGSYTWSKSIDTGSTSVGSDAFSNSLIGMQWFYPSINRGLSDFDLRHNFMANIVWDIGGPIDLSARGKLQNKMLRGWEVGTITELSSGIPFNPILGGDPTGQGTTNAEDLPDRTCKQLTNPGNPAQFIHLECLAFPNPVNRYGNFRRNSAIGPGLVSVDASIVKNTSVAEHLNVQFRAEAFNVINHANFAPPIDNQTVFDQDGNLVPGAGQIDQTQTPAREIQFALKLIF